MAEIPPMNEREINRAVFRIGLLGRRGVADVDTMVDTILVRDRERDDRRACVECSHWRRDLSCASPQAKTLPPAFRPFNPGHTVLHRCVAFNWQLPA